MSLEYFVTTFTVVFSWYSLICLHQ